MHERLGLPLQYNIRYQCQCRHGASVKNLNTAEVGYVTIQNGGCAVNCFDTSLWALRSLDPDSGCTSLNIS